MENDLLVKRLRQKYTSFKPIVCEGEPDAKSVYLDVGVQHFKVADAEDTNHAEWYRDMLAKALSKIVEELEL